MASEGSMSFQSQIIILTEMVKRLTQQFEEERASIAKHVERMEVVSKELREQILELKMIMKDLLAQGSKVDVNGCQNQSTAVHSLASSSMASASSAKSNDDQLVNQLDIKLDDSLELTSAKDTVSQTLSLNIQDIAEVRQVVPESLDPSKNDEDVSSGVIKRSSTSSSQVVVDSDSRFKEVQLEAMDIINVPSANTPMSSSSVIPSSAHFIRCQFCPRSFKHRRFAKSHMKLCKISHDEMLRCRKTCESLDKRFSHLREMKPLNLNKTYRSRRVMDMIKCSHCIRTFPTKNQVKSHERVHTGDRPYACHICGQRFGHTGNAIKHVKRMHPSENPYLCRCCKTTFKTSTEVREHRRRCPLAPQKSSGKRRRESEDTETASEDENSTTSSADNYQHHRTGDARQIEFNVGSMPSLPPPPPCTSLMDLLTGREETFVAVPQSSALGDNVNTSYGNSDDKSTEDS